MTMTKESKVQHPLVTVNTPFLSIPFKSIIVCDFLSHFDNKFMDIIDLAHLIKVVSITTFQNISFHFVLNNFKLVMMIGMVMNVATMKCA